MDQELQKVKNDLGELVYKFEQSERKFNTFEEDFIQELDSIEHSVVKLNNLVTEVGHLSEQMDRLEKKWIRGELQQDKQNKKFIEMFNLLVNATKDSDSEEEEDDEDDDDEDSWEPSDEDSSEEEEEEGKKKPNLRFKMSKMVQAYKDSKNIRPRLVKRRIEPLLLKDKEEEKEEPRRSKRARRITKF